MPTKINEANIFFKNANGRTIAMLTIAPSSTRNVLDEPPLLELTSEEAQEWAEETIQLLEGQSYEYKLSAPDSWRLVEDTTGVIKPSRLSEGKQIIGRIEPGLNTGLLPFVLEKIGSTEMATAAVEVRTSKLNYRQDYRFMLDYIADSISDLVLDLRAPAHARLTEEPAKTPQTIAQQFSFLKSILISKDFREAVERVVMMPHRLIKHEQQEHDIRAGFKSGRDIMRQVASGQPRLNIPNSHPLYKRLPTLPIRITTAQVVDDLDTPENRFVKYVLSSFENFLIRIEKQLNVLRRKSSSSVKVVENLQNDRLFKEVAQCRKLISEYLSREIFKEISEPEVLPLGSPVLQRKAGYREIYRAWLKFNLSARLSWEGGLDVYGAGKRDVAILYEYWVFFQLFNLMKRLFKLPETSLIEKTNDGFGLKIKSGNALYLKGTYDDGLRKLEVKFCYNRTFSRRNGEGAYGEFYNYPQPGSWTQQMRPDYTLSIWPVGFKEEEAEAQELIVHIHFDAKYRVEKLKNLFGDDTDTELHIDKDAQRKNLYSKRADLLKMHAYRDAIRRTEGSYVIYPGDKQMIWQGFHEILPGLGAFPLSPGNSSNEIQRLEVFTKEILEHLSDRASRRETQTYHLFRTQNSISIRPIYEALPEQESFSKQRAVPPTQQLTLVSCYRYLPVPPDPRQILKHYIPLGEIDGSSVIASGFTRCEYMLLYTLSGEPLQGLWRIDISQLRLFSGQALTMQNSIGNFDQDTLYAEIKIDFDKNFESFHWSKESSLNANESQIYTLSFLLNRFLIKIP